jgi:hypothetical protein
MKKKILIIGSGLAGSMVSSQLALKYEVVLLELGSREAIDYPSVQFIRKHFGAVKTFCFGQGGTTNIWDNGLIPIRPDDCSMQFGRILNEAMSYMDLAATKLFFENNYGAAYKAITSEMSGIAKSVGVFSDGVDCLLYPKRHKGLRVSSRVKAYYKVDGIDFNVENGRIKSIRYAVGSRNETVDPDMVIICAGALGSPFLVQKILAGAGCSSGSAGKGLADHPMGFIGKFRVKNEFRKRIQKMVCHDKGDYLCRTAVRLKSHCGNFTCCAFFRPALTMQNRLSLYKYKSLLGASSGMERLRSACSWKIFHPDILAEIYAHIFGVQLKSRIFNILVLFEQKRGGNRVYYHGGDIKVDWRVTEEELAIYNEVVDKLYDMLRPISEDLVIQRPLTEDWLWSAAHHSGTISMGDRPDDLLDQDLRLRACNNVFVCDGSVIQEHSYANTGLTIGQLAMRLADKLLKEI